MKTRLLLLALLFGTITAVGADNPKKPLPDAAQRAIDFDKDVQPILAEHCVKCHGERDKGGLRLNNAKDALAGGNSGPAIVLNKSAESALIHAVVGTDVEKTMPPGDTKKLTAEQVGILRAWIDQGAKWGAETKTVAAKSTHWSFQPLTAQNSPLGARNGIDHFIRQRLVKEHLGASPEADKPTLIRRVYFDLIGLPPTPEEVDAFVKDEKSTAFEDVVDRLLASPHYGERWGRHWLDVARYADSDGYEKDTGRPFAWRYRDWVIAALNRDLPFDQFTIQQLAGDLLPNATIEQKTATGFHRNTLTNKEGGVDQEEYRVAAVVDRVNTTATTWLGLTVGCCQCHDHKYDPLSQREYYQLFAFFNSDREVDLEAPLPGEAEKLKAATKEADAERKKLKADIEEAKEKKLSTSELVKRETALKNFEKKQPTATKVQTITLGKARPTNVMIRGDFLRKGVVVQPDTPSVLPKAKVSANRLDLAKWLVSQENPLTTRVTVNWVWGKFFGRGLVATQEDFGTQGQPPSHPELLDWLAVTFRDEHKWSLKKLHKLIVMSETYRQSSAMRKELVERDPLNVLLARQSRLRLESEIVRDNALAVSGLLTRTVGGPSIRPPQPPGISELTYANSAKWVESTGAERYKRGLYIWFQRTSPYPTLMMFDEPDSNVCVVKRERSNTPLQALTILNDTVFVEAAQALAKRVLTEKKDEAQCDVAHRAFRLSLGRDWTPIERERVLKLFTQMKQLAEKEPSEAAKLVGKTKPDGVKPEEAAAWVGLCRMLLNLDEFVTRE
jgi:mono/diheme cytochrome c family protein